MKTYIPSEDGRSCIAVDQSEDRVYITTEYRVMVDDGDGRASYYVPSDPPEWEPRRFDTLCLEPAQAKKLKELL